MTVLKLADATLEERSKLATRTDWAWSPSFRWPTGGLPAPDQDGWVHLPPMTDVLFRSKNSGTFELGLYPGPTGRPAFDRVNYSEGAGVATATWGYGEDGEIMLVLLKEARPAADIAPCFSDCTVVEHGFEHVVFAHSPMGFATDSQIKTKIGTLINFSKAAEKEVIEELGNSAVIEIFEPKGKIVYANPSFMKSWTTIRFVQVDLDKFEQPKGDGDEILLGFMVCKLADVMRFIAAGKTDDNAMVAEGVGAFALSTFICSVLTDPDGWRKAHPDVREKGKNTSSV